MSLAQHVLTRLVDDLDGSEAVVTVSFSLDGRSYEIDLSQAHLAEFRAAVDPFVTAARRVSGGDESRRVATDEPGEVASIRRNVHAVSSGGGVPTAEAGAAPAAPTTSTPPPAREQEAAAGPGVPPVRPERKRAPLVADPFNPQAQIG